MPIATSPMMRPGDKLSLDTVRERRWYMGSGYVTEEYMPRPVRLMSEPPESAEQAEPSPNAAVAAVAAVTAEPGRTADAAAVAAEAQRAADAAAVERAFNGALRSLQR